MQTLRLLCLAAAVALTSVPPARGQSGPVMSTALVRQLQDVEVQEQLIALGVLDATAGHASRGDLRTAVEWFRRANQSARGMEPLSDDEREKLKQAKAKFYAATGLKEVTYKDSKTGTDIHLLVPLRFVGGSSQKFDGDWQEYRDSDGKVAIGPVVHLLSEFTPIALFRQNIMQVSLRYKHLHLTSEEFAALGEADDEHGGYASSNLALTFTDRLKGVFMRYPKAPVKSFVEVPDFLVPVVATELPSPGTAKPDPTPRGWQLLMQSVANLVVSQFPLRNGWKAVSSQPCPLSLDEPAGQPKSTRILFGTDRKAKSAATQKGGAVADPDSLFANEPGNLLHLGCAYVVSPVKNAESARDLATSKITMYQWLHSTPKADLGDQLILTNELAESASARTRQRAPVVSRQTRGKANPVSASSALVFIHGYNVSFKDALFTASQVASDIGYEGRVYMYSWPSAASTIRYISDLDNAEQAEPFFRSFMKLLLRDADIDYVDILVHSMGSQAVARALSSLQSVFETERRGADASTKIRIGQIMFAAPDVARPVFDQKIRRIASHANRVTVYASSTDAALLGSRLLRSGALRVGELDSDGEPLLVEVKNVHVIDATGPERWWRGLFQFGHDYFQQDKNVQLDIKRILTSQGTNEDVAPDVRSPDLFDKAVFKDNKKWSFWRLRDQPSQEKK